MEVFKGYVDHIVYRNAENGYTVLELEQGGEEPIYCVGIFPGLDAGETIEVEGCLVDHPVYGTQIKASSWRAVPPDDVTSMERYLASGAVKGIGPTLAARIIKQFGDDTFRIMEEEPERLTAVKGISERIAREIADQMEEKKDLRNAMVFLQQYGVSNTLAVKIFDTYGTERLYQILRENPYKMAEDITGVGFKIADDIASRIGIRADSEYRIRSGILYCLLQAEADGNSFLPEEMLRQKAEELLQVPMEGIEKTLLDLMVEKKVVLSPSEDGSKRVYSASFYYEELKCARMLLQLNVPLYAPEGTQLLPVSEWEERIPEADRRQVENRLAKLEKTEEITLDELQKKAIRSAAYNGVFILSGGPGTGKTTTINTMIRYFESEGMDIALAAPTGRAAKRMTEATGMEARTLHRLLELSGGMGDDKQRARFERNSENPLEYDVIIVDEMSMVDLHLLYALLLAVGAGTRLILVGDVDQLPSVGPGQVLRDMMESGVFPMVVLKHIFRQAGSSDIVMNAHHINEGESIRLDNKSKDFFFLERDNPEVIYKHMIQLIRDKLPSYVQADQGEIQVLTPMRKGSLGAQTLNKILQQYLNPAGPDREEYEYGEHLIREGDKVMQIKNNYQLEWQIFGNFHIPVEKGLGIFNGDMGIVREISKKNQIVSVEFDEGRMVDYPFSQLDELELAYAITIHKSQGSEYPAVLMPLLSGPRVLMNRNLLYTGVTRAKNCVVILGSSQTLKEMIANESENKRFTTLKERILELQDADKRLQENS